MLNNDLLRARCTTLHKVLEGALRNGALDEQPSNTPMANNRDNYLDEILLLTDQIAEQLHHA